MEVLVIALSGLAASSLLMAALRIWRIADYRLRDVAVERSDYAYFVWALIVGVALAALATGAQSLLPRS